jgi:phage terminase large subunit GpA-like protein
MATIQPHKPASCKYADSGRLIAQTLEALRPPQAVSTADYAAAHRVLTNAGGGSQGRWAHEKAPYLVGIMDAIDSPDHTTVAIAGPGQCGKTAVQENWLMRNVGADQADMLWYQHTDASIDDYVKQTINPLIFNHETMRSRMGRARTDNSLSFKRFRGMTVRFLSFTSSNLVQKYAPRIVADEFDAYDPSIGDPKTLLDVRRQTFGRASKLVALSHPDLAGGSKPADWNKGVMALYRDSDRRCWWWACRQCGFWSSPNPGARFQMVLTYDEMAPLDDIAEHAHLLCPHNGCVITDADIRFMNLTGKWIGLGQVIDQETGEVSGALLPRDTAGFWIMGVMSPFLMHGVGGLARNRVAAERAYAVTGETKTLRQVMCKQLGVPFDPPRQAGAVDANTLAARADDALRLGTVPRWVRFITGAMDVQGNRFEMLWRGWGAQRESVVIDTRILDATAYGAAVDPATDPGCWDSALEMLMDAEFPLADGSGRVMRVLSTGIDSQGADGFTIQAYAVWSRLRIARKARFLGNVSGREAYNVLCLRGASALQAQTLTVTKPDIQRKDRRANARGEVPLGVFNPNSFKSILADQLARDQIGPGYVHFPAGLRSADPPHLWFAQLVAERKLPTGRWEKIKDGARNEALDLMVMAAVICHLRAPSRFDWSLQRVPNWARDWDENSQVGLPTVKDGQQKAAVRGASALPAAPAPPPRAPARVAGLTVAQRIEAIRAAKHQGAPA